MEDKVSLCIVSPLKFFPGIYGVWSFDVREKKRRESGEIKEVFIGGMRGLLRICKHSLRGIKKIVGFYLELTEVELKGQAEGCIDISLGKHCHVCKRWQVQLLDLQEEHRSQCCWEALSSSTMLPHMWEKPIILSFGC